MKKIPFIIYGLLFLFASCERYKDVDLNAPFKSKLVLFSVLEGNHNNCSLLLNKTRPVIGGSDTFTQPDFVEDAEVVMVHNNVRYTFSYDTQIKRYVLNLGSNVFTTGSSYYIEAITPGEKVTGTAIIPDTPKIQCSIALESVPGSNIFMNRIKFKYTLLTSSTNILLVPKLVNEDSSEQEMEIDLSENPILAMKQGQTVEKIFSDFSDAPWPGKTVGVKLQVIACSDAYAAFYNKHATLNFGNELGGISEPIITKGNLSNGIGLFGAFVKSEELFLEIK